MRELRVPDFVATAAAGKRELIFIVAPNYEPRSLVAVGILLPRLLQSGVPLRVVRCELQSHANRVDSLEHHKREAREAVQSLLKSLGIPSAEERIPYPDEFTPQSMRALLAQLVRVCECPSDLLFDISALPRRLLVPAFRELRSLQRSGKIARLYICYVWAAAYPSAALPFEVGGLRVIESAITLSEFLGRWEVEECWAAVFPGREGFDSRQLLDQLPRGRHVRVFAFMNRRGVLRSLDMLRANASLLVDPSLEVSYYLTIREARSRLLNWAREVPLRDRACYLVAPFGPKPLVLCGVEAIDIMRGRLAESNIESSEADLVLLSATDYVSTYSEGSGDVSIAEFGDAL